jgi:hypothetical protein
MMMKYEFTLEFVELDQLPVELGGDVGLPIFGDLGELFGDIDFRHRHPKSLSAHRLQIRLSAIASLLAGPN